MSTNSKLTVSDWLSSGTSLLRSAGIETPRLDCLVILEDTLGINRASLLAHPDTAIEKDVLDKLNTKLKSRAKHRPLAYIRNQANFYGRTFFVDERVLVPRPETETMITELYKMGVPKDYIIADIGTGSGALGITAALELIIPSVDLYDISSEALDVAGHNSSQYGLQLKAKKSDLLKNLVRIPQVVLANLPYVPTDHPVNKATNYEPHEAIYADDGGMALYEKFWDQLGNIKGVKLVLTESLPHQHNQQTKLAERAGYKNSRKSGYIQVFELSE